MAKELFEFEIDKIKFSENNSFQVKLNFAKVRLAETLNFFSQNNERKVHINSVGQLILKSPNRSDLVFNVELIFSDPRIGGFYYPQLEDLGNERKIYLNTLALIRYSVDDIVYILLHEMIHAGILTGFENHDEAITDKLAIKLCKDAGLDITLTSGYVDLRNNLAKFGNRVNEWFEKIMKEESLTYESNDYNEQLAEAVISLIFGEDDVTSFSWSSIRKFINNHKVILEKIFPRLISLTNKGQMQDEASFHIHTIEENLQKQFAQKFFDSEERRTSFLRSFSTFWSSKICQYEDRMPNHMEMIFEFLKQNEAIYLYDFAQYEILQLIQESFLSKKFVKIDFTNINQEPSKIA